MHGLLYQQLLSHQYRGVSAAHISNFCTLQSLANKRGLCVKPYNHTKFQDSVLNLAFFRITVSQDYRIPCRLAVFRSLRAAELAGNVCICYSQRRSEILCDKYNSLYTRASDIVCYLCAKVVDSLFVPRHV